MSYTLVKASPGAFDVRRYDVFNEAGRLLGQVALTEVPWERKRKGNRYVNARGYTKKWTVNAKDFPTWRDYTTRKEAIAALVKHVGP